MLQFGLIDGIIPEPDGGAHWDYDGAAQLVKNYIKPVLQELKQVSPEERIKQRIEKFGKMGFWEELPQPAEQFSPVKIDENNL
jgi:acetyl-CoA carboxylase carboxyl transferase subunit alpha